jgi:hypothetical protein
MFELKNAIINNIKVSRFYKNKITFAKQNVLSRYTCCNEESLGNTEQHTT